MNNKLKQKELESTIAKILGSSDEDLLKMIEEADSGVYGNCTLPVFMPVMKTTVISSEQPLPSLPEGMFVYLGVLTKLGIVCSVEPLNPQAAKAANSEELALAA